MLLTGDIIVQRNGHDYGHCTTVVKATMSHATILVNGERKRVLIRRLIKQGYRYWSRV